MDIKKLKVAVAAALLAAHMSTPAEAAVNRDQLLVIRDYIAATDHEGLLAFLEANPSLMQGTSLVSGRLARYYNQQSGRSFFFGGLHMINGLGENLSKVRSNNGIY